MRIIKLLKSLFGLSSTQHVSIDPVESQPDANDIFKHMPPHGFASSVHSIEVKEISFEEFSKLNKAGV